MKFVYRLLGICSCLFITACTKNNIFEDKLVQDKFVRVYFNHRQTNNRTYTDPYRNLEHSGDDLEAIIIQEIATAKFSIDLAVQELNLPRVARALAEKHLAGVEVRVILDNSYSRSLAKLSPTEISSLNKRDRQKYERHFQLIDLDRNGQLSTVEVAQRDAISILERAGINIIDDTADGSKGSGLMHHKFMVIDRQTVVTGSANFTLSGLVGDINNPASKGNVNHLLVVNNTQAADLFTEEFNYMWGNSALGITSKFGLAKPRRMPKTISWENNSVTIQFAPTSTQQSWSLSTNGLIANTISKATKSIDLALFVFSEQKLADILQTKKRSGVAIRGVFDAGFAYRYYSEVLDMLGLSLYFRCRVEDHNNPWVNSLDTVGIARLNYGDKLHHKFTVIDNKTTISGSQNWSRAANRINDEVVIVINNYTVTRHFVREFKRLYSDALLDLPFKIKQKIDRQYEKCN